jgi:drug/metabolite transporter (DMT)-like permease
VIYVLLRTLFNTGFSQGLKVAQVRDGQMLTAALVNYGVAAVVTCGLFLLQDHPHPQSITLWLGVATGFTYAISLLGLETAMRLSGVSIAVAVLQLSVLVPTVASMVLFNERPSGLQLIGVGAAVIALILLSRSSATQDMRHARPRDMAVAILLLFFVTGCSGVMMKMFQEYAPAADRQAYTAALFVASFVVTGGAVLKQRTLSGPATWTVGTAVGIANVLQLECTLRALSLLPAVIVFPISSALTVALNAILSIWFWKERPGGKALAGIALAIVAALLINR